MSARRSGDFGTSADGSRRRGRRSQQAQGPTRCFGAIGAARRRSTHNSGSHRLSSATESPHRRARQSSSGLSRSRRRSSPWGRGGRPSSLAAPGRVGRIGDTDEMRGPLPRHIPRDLKSPSVRSSIETHEGGGRPRRRITRTVATRMTTTAAPPPNNSSSSVADRPKISELAGPTVTFTVPFVLPPTRS
jgi:hypothetical protein